MKLSNIWKAWLSSLLGLLIPIITLCVSDLFTGSINWTAVKASLAPALALLVTDILKEIQNEITPKA
jgi:hypothetical protein